MKGKNEEDVLLNMKGKNEEGVLLNMKGKNEEDVLLNMKGKINGQNFHAISTNLFKENFL